MKTSMKLETYNSVWIHVFPKCFFFTIFIYHCFLFTWHIITCTYQCYTTNHTEYKLLLFVFS